MKYSKTILLMILMLMLTACTSTEEQDSDASLQNDVVEISLSDDGVRVDGKAADSDVMNAVYVANDIVYYEEGKDFTYGEGTEKESHSEEVAGAHTVVHITKPGTYKINGTLSQGQIAVDLGEDAKENPEAVVTLILNGADITCEVAPAIIFYNVYECGMDDADSASKDVDTSAAGANVIIADDTTNTMKGSYVARIYEPDSVVLNEDGTEVEDADKLHKYDGAFYSKMSMNITGGEESTGILNIEAENEGLDSELHLTINGGNINIYSGNDGINTNEDGVSVTTINNGVLKIKVTGETGEGDGIDSNGWLVINGGTVMASACSKSADAGIDSDMGIHINGGTVMASGHMLDQIEAGGQTYAVFSFAQEQDGSSRLCLKNEQEESFLEWSPENGYSIVVYSSPDLSAGVYTLWSDEHQLSGQSGTITGGAGRPNGMMPPEGMEDMTPPEGMEDMTPPEGMEGMTPPEGMEDMVPPEEMEGNMPEERPDGPPGGKGNSDEEGENNEQETTSEFVIYDGANMFSNIFYLE